METRQNKIEENPNPNAKIGFVIFNPFQFYVYKNVYKHLKENAEFIVDGGRFIINEQLGDILEKTVALLIKNNAYFRIIYHEDYFHYRYLQNFFVKYYLLVSLWYSGCVMLPCNINKKKVHMNYGAGKELTVFAIKHRNWDLYLCLGENIYNIIKLFTWAEIVGYPKFDDWFNNELDGNFLEDLKEILDLNKKTVLYLPTHSDLSSIDELAPELKKLAKNYNVIAKIHYYTLREEPERVNKLKRQGLILFEDDVDLLPLLKVSDVVISDNSSAIFDAILADKPVVATNFLFDEYLDVIHKKIKQFRFRFPEGALTYSGSIEQKIKKEHRVLTVDKPEFLEDTIEKALNDEQFYKEERKKIRSELFAFDDGNCGKRAAMAISKLLVLEKLPEKPVLFHVLESEKWRYEENLFQYNDLWALAKGNNFINRGSSRFWNSRAGRKAAALRYRRIMQIKSLPIWQKIIALLREFF